jgi:hypothetical protein
MYTILPPEEESPMISNSAWIVIILNFEEVRLARSPDLSNIR